MTLFFDTQFFKACTAQMVISTNIIIMILQKQIESVVSVAITDDQIRIRCQMIVACLWIENRFAPPRTLMDGDLKLIEE